MMVEETVGDWVENKNTNTFKCIHPVSVVTMRDFTAIKKNNILLQVGNGYG